MLDAASIYRDEGELPGDVETIERDQDQDCEEPDECIYGGSLLLAWTTVDV